MYVCVLDMAVQKANSTVSFMIPFKNKKLRHWRKNAQRAKNNFIDYSKCLLQPTTTISFVDVTLTLKLLSNTMSVFHGVKNDLIFKKDPKTYFFVAKDYISCLYATEFASKMWSEPWGN